MYKGKTWLEWLAYAFDNKLSKTDTEQLQTAVNESDILKATQRNLLRNRETIAGFKVDFSSDFTDQVMRHLEEAIIVPFSTKVVRLFPKVAAACVLFLLSAYVALQFGDTTWVSDALVGTSELNPEDAFALSTGF